MVETITPVVHGGRRVRWGASLTLHVLGAAVSAAALGGALGGAGALLGGPWGGAGAALVALVAAAYAARELFGVPIPVPERRRQVPEWWRSFFGPGTASLLYGLGLGVGYLTHLRHGTLVAVSAVAFAVADPLAGAAVAIGFGLGRALGLSVVAGARTSAEVNGVVDGLERLGAGPAPRIVNGGVLLMLTGTAAIAVLPAEAGAVGSLSVALVAALFAWAAASKAAAWDRWRELLRGYELEGLERVARRTVPCAEAAVPALLVAGLPGAAAMLALVLLATFSAAIVRARHRRGDRVPCGCFGGRSLRDYRLLLARNAALAAIAAVGLLRTGVSEPFPIMLPRPGEALPFALAILGVAIGMWTLRATLAVGRRG